VIKNISVDNTNGAPIIAPMPIWIVSGALKKINATNGMIICGMDVPMIDRMPPTIPSDNSNLFPNHSIALLKKEHEIRINPMLNINNIIDTKISILPP
jgi:hypothetical protein